LIGQFFHIRGRRSVLRAAIDLDRGFSQWEETCVPSYCHPNVAAAYVSWLRLFAAARLAKSSAASMNRVLDFGASVGELYHLLDQVGKYDFIEQNDVAASVLRSQIAIARRLTIQEAPKRVYDVIFAVDALEHNANYAGLIRGLSLLLAPKGILVLCGPTENMLYKVGRHIAGFQGDYHLATIYDIEAVASNYLEKVHLTTIPFGLPLFRLTTWRLLSAAPEVAQAEKQ
jgi:SAM-dependent methyltransferase